MIIFIIIYALISIGAYVQFLYNDNWEKRDDFNELPFFGMIFMYVFAFLFVTISIPFVFGSLLMDYYNDAS